MSEPRGGPRPPQQGSKRANTMVTMAQDHGKHHRPPAPLAPPPKPTQTTITFKRRMAKRDVEDDGDDFSVFSSMISTPKKQRIVERTPQPAVTVWPPSALGPASLLLKSIASTQMIDCYTDGTSKQRFREQRMEEEQRRALHSSGGSRSSGWDGCSGSSFARLPSGMRNLGNTCYLNAVLQVLLSLPSFLADLKQGRQQLQAAGQPLSSNGVYLALLDCVVAKDNPSGHAYITPASLKRALDAASAAFQGAFQQDAHELLCSLLDVLQSEVLVREVARFGRTRIRITETADPVARNFGFAVQHELTCSRCGHASCVLEEYTHLSLELPEAQPGSFDFASSIAQLLSGYFKEEEVEKSCEECGDPNLPHSLCHTIRRLPRILCLHMKRFKVTWDSAQKQAVCQKLHTSIEIPEAVRLCSYLAAGALPPLPGGQLEELGKENEQQQANIDPRSHEGPKAATAALPAPARPDSQPKPRSGVCFYGGSGGGMPIASKALLSTTPQHGSHTYAVDRLDRRRPGTPCAGLLLKGSSVLVETEDDEDLKQALACSLLEHEHGQQLQPQQGELQQGLQLAGDLRRAGAEEEGPAMLLVRAGSPCATAAAEVVLPSEVEAAAAAAATGCGSHQLQDQWFMRLGLDPGSACKQQQHKRGGDMRRMAAEQEDEELQRAIELSMLEEQQRQALACGGGDAGSTPAAAAAADTINGAVTPVVGLLALGEAAAGAAAANEDADLQRALQISLLDFDSGCAAAAAAAAPTAAQQQQKEQQREQQQQEQQQKCHGPAFLSVFGQVLWERTDGAEASSAAAVSPAAAFTATEQQGQEVGGPTAADTDVVNLAGGDAAGAEAVPVGDAAAGPAQAPAYLHAEIVEDDVLLSVPEALEGVPEAAAGAAAKGAEEAGGISSSTMQPPALYRLHAVVNHEGPAASCGHFTSDICDATTHDWHRLNDSLTSRISVVEACSSTRQRECYLLFYVAVPSAGQQ